MLNVQLKPDYTKVIVLVSDVYEAIKQNGFDHIRGDWITWENGKPVGACVLGQGALNLSVVAEPDGVADDTDTLIMQLNRWSVPDSSKWYQPSDDRVGATIIYWNDRLDVVTSQYTLKTYEEVTQMVYDLLKPHMGEKVHLLSFDYSGNSEESDEGYEM